MNATIIEQAPSIPSLYWHALFKRPSVPSDDLQQAVGMGIRLNDITIDEPHLNRFQAFMGLMQCKIVPLMYPHLLSFRLQLKLLLDKRLPFPVMGLVHLANHMELLAPLDITKCVDVLVSVESLEQGKKGLNTRILSQIYQAGELVWQSHSDYLYPTAHSDKPHKPAQQQSHTTTDIDTDWIIPANLGRQFAALTGDANPIHLSNLSAKLFGFKQAIAHGMCVGTMALYRCDASTDIQRASLHFKKPVYLPSKLCIKTFKTEDNAQAFSVLDAKGKVKFEGHWSR